MTSTRPIEPRLDPERLPEIDPHHDVWARNFSRCSRMTERQKIRAIWLAWLRRSRSCERHLRGMGDDPRDALRNLTNEI